MFEFSGYLAPDSSNPVEPPPFDESTKPTTTTIVARFLDNYFSHANGELINYTVIIAQEGKCDSCHSLF